MLWCCSRYLSVVEDERTSSEKPIQYHVLVANMLEAILFLSQLAIVKYAAHTADPVTDRNVSADSATKYAAIASSSMVCH